jgi:hypothetical protein
MFLRGNDGGDKELGAVGVLAGVGHGQNTGLGVLELEVLIGELGTVDYRHRKESATLEQGNAWKIFADRTHWTCHRYHHR